jgi:predicted transcriptional regulator
MFLNHQFLPHLFYLYVLVNNNMAGGAISLFLRPKPTKTLILLRDRSKVWYVSKLAKEVDTTYPHMVKLIKTLESMGIVRTKKEGRTRYVELTDKGEELAHDLEGLYRHISREL